MIEINNISKKFIIKNIVVEALQDINLIIEEKDCFAIVGESGSGKTTLANIMLGIYQQDEGDILFEKKQLHRKRSLYQRKLIQYVQQNPMSTLNPKKTILNTISLPLKIHNIVNKNQINERVKKLLSYVGLDPEFMVRYPDTLSGGQKQRVAIARALASEPRVLILDEPTSALDLKYQVQILNILKRLNEEKNITVIMAMHDLNLASRYCQRLILLQDGAIVQDGTPEEVLQKEIIENVYGVEVNLHTLDGGILVHPVINNQ